MKNKKIGLLLRISISLIGMIGIIYMLISYIDNTKQQMYKVNSQTNIEKITVNIKDINKYLYFEYKNIINNNLLSKVKKNQYKTINNFDVKFISSKSKNYKDIRKIKYKIKYYEDNLYIVGFFPLLNEKEKGTFEIKTKIKNLSENIKIKYKQNILIVLNNSILESNIDFEKRSKLVEEFIGNKSIIKNENQDFIKKVKMLSLEDYKKLQNKRYLIIDNYFVSIKTIFDDEYKKIGEIIISEEINDETKVSSMIKLFEKSSENTLLFNIMFLMVASLIFY